MDCRRCDLLAEENELLREASHNNANLVRIENQQIVDKLNAKIAQLEKELEAGDAYNTSVSKRNRELEKRLKAACVVQIIKGDDDDDDDEEEEEEGGGEKFRPMYQIPFMPFGGSSYTSCLFKVLTPPLIKNVVLKKGMMAVFAIEVIKKYERVFMEAARRYEKFARNNVPAEAREFDGGEEWTYLHLSTFKSANPPPGPAVLKVYKPEEVLFWHRKHFRHRIDNDLFLAGAAKHNRVTTIQEVKDHFKRNVK